MVYAVNHRLVIRDYREKNTLFLPANFPIYRLRAFLSLPLGSDRRGADGDIRILYVFVAVVFPERGVLPEHNFKSM